MTFRASGLKNNERGRLEPAFGIVEIEAYRYNAFILPMEAGSILGEEWATKR
jgi:hypothetical protein